MELVVIKLATWTIHAVVQQHVDLAMLVKIVKFRISVAALLA
jgi:hypothetical protein